MVLKSKRLFFNGRVPMQIAEHLNVAHPHTIKKFELIERYIASWSQKLLLTDTCNTLVFIDCMCNSGIYINDAGAEVEGTAIRVAKILRKAAKDYPNKEVLIFLNDIEERKIQELKRHLPPNTSNFHVYTDTEDAGLFLDELAPIILTRKNLHYFLLYDPYKAAINWDALEPYFKEWGEVLINHMVSDSVRAIKTVKRESTKKKYEQTYREKFEELAPYGSNKEIYEKRVEDIIQTLSGDQSYFVAAFPFYNKKNALVYNLVHGTKHLVGFNLYKQCAWKVFGGFSSSKHEISVAKQFSFNFDQVDDAPKVDTDESCYDITDIAAYINHKFRGEKLVPVSQIWEALKYHPIFPSDGFKKEIRRDLENIFHARFILNKASGKWCVSFV